MLMNTCKMVMLIPVPCSLALQTDYSTFIIMHHIPYFMAPSKAQPLLTDFGLFDLIDPPLVNRLGTINWTSPECLLNPKGSAAGDVWAFAMTTLELFTRVLPFDSIRRPEELRRHIFRGPPDRLSNETTYERLTDGWWEICLLIYFYYAVEVLKYYSTDVELLLFVDLEVLYIYATDMVHVWYMEFCSTCGLNYI
ncbi:hypothetical protein J3A83DRAFT_368589 [Scleroderma citrinum]